MSEVFFDEFDPEELESGGRPKPGKAMLLVGEVEDKDEYVSVSMEVLAHEKGESEVGKVSYNFFNKTGKGAKRALLFALATGIITKQDLGKAKATGTSVEIDFDQASGSVFLGTLEASEYQGKQKCRVEWDFKTLDHPEAGSYPANQDFLPGNNSTSVEPAEDIPF